MIEFIKSFFKANPNIALDIVKGKVKGWTSACVYFSYSLILYTARTILYSVILFMVMGGFIKDFTVSLPTLKDLFIPIFLGVVCVCSIALISAFGGCYIDYKNGTINMKGKTEEPQQETVSQ